MLQLGWKAATEQYPPAELLDYAIAAEKAGFDVIDVSDHFHPWSEAGQASFAWTWLGAAAARTSRIGLGTGLTCPILRYHPAIVAQAAATLSQLAPGRVFLGVGTGEALNEYPVTATWPGYAERRARLREAIGLIRVLWTGEEITFEGTYYHTRKARLFTPPVSRIPVLVSALAPESAEFAGQVGDGLLTVGGRQLGVYREMVAAFERGAWHGGKDPSTMERMIELRVAYTDDGEATLAETRRFWAGAFVPAMYVEKIYTPKMSARNGEVVGADTISHSSHISADASSHARFAEQYVDLGFDRLIFHSGGPDQRGFIERYGREVLPAIRAGIGRTVRSAAA